MVGAVIGAQLGASALPREWSDVVQHRDYLVFLADRLASASGAKATEKAGEILEVTGDIATRTVDVVVNAWSRNVIPTWLLLPQGVSGALRRAGGRCALREISRRAPLPLGAASETAAGNLRARCVVHAAGIDLGWRASEASVRLSTQSSLSLARWLGARTVALPLIGAGSGGMSEAVVRRVMLEELQRAKATFDRLELVAYGRS
jgi:O-acetyl-ADP-ribose deacetylase (regulator of RNase III)